MFLNSSDSARGLIISLMLHKKILMSVTMEAYLTHCFGSAANSVQIQSNWAVQISKKNCWMPRNYGGTTEPMDNKSNQIGVMK